MREKIKNRRPSPRRTHKEDKGQALQRKIKIEVWETSKAFPSKEPIFFSVHSWEAPFPRIMADEPSQLWKKQKQRKNWERSIAKECEKVVPTVLSTLNDFTCQTWAAINVDPPEQCNRSKLTWQVSHDRSLTCSGSLGFSFI